MKAIEKKLSPKKTSQVSPRKETKKKIVSDDSDDEPLAAKLARKTASIEVCTNVFGGQYPCIFYSAYFPINFFGQAHPILC